MKFWALFLHPYMSYNLDMLKSVLGGLVLCLVLCCIRSLLDPSASSSGVLLFV